MEDYIQNEFLGGKIFKSRKATMAANIRPTVADDPLAAICQEPTELEKSLEATNTKTNIKVTFHLRELFMSTYKEYFEDYEVIE